MLARNGSSGVGWTLPSTSIARDVIVCSPAAGRPQSKLQNRQANSVSPCEPLRLRAWSVSQVRLEPGAVVDPHLDGRDRRAPCGAEDGVALAVSRDLCRRRLQTIVVDRRERPDGLAIPGLLADRHVVPRHEPPAVAAVADLDARQPLDVGDAVPPWRDEAERGSVLGRQGRAVHLVAEEVVGVQRVRERHAAGEALGDREIEAPAAVRSRPRPSSPGSRIPELSRIVTWPESAPQNTTSAAVSRIPARSSTGASGVPAQRALPTPPMKNGRPGIARALHGELDLASPAGLEIRPASATAASRRGPRSRGHRPRDRHRAARSG